MSVKLISITPDAEKTIVYVARVSSPHQDNPEYAGLIRYLIAHQHWSPLEHAYMTIEIETSRMISAQILRHRSFTFSEFSQRYSEPMGCVMYDARRQADKNRQSSVDDLSQEVKEDWIYAQERMWGVAEAMYKMALEKGIAKECARAVLPMNTTTRLYMTGSVRSWIHYLQLRTQEDTQKEHREIAEKCREIFVEKLPTVARALGWK
jgi:thymidylate synthase (FAD)